MKRFWPVLLAWMAWLLVACSAQPAPATLTPVPTLLAPFVGDPARGQTLFDAPALGQGPGCSACHSLEEGVNLVGPSLAHIATLAAQRLQDGSYAGAADSVVAYLWESIVAPDAYLHPGYQPGSMYGRYGVELSPQEIADLVAFLLSLK